MLPIAFTRPYPQQKKSAKKGTKRFLQNMKNFCVTGTGRQKALDKEKEISRKTNQIFPNRQRESCRS
jgi:hypothetical protein